ncbi:hypothetical protein FQA39_LY03857 [Lamprigera yunnana]|nr:hypothetical protein FQA39_LY03857 [Lamprigera yunnana]
MTKQASNPIDVQDFQFRLHSRLKIFLNDENDPFQKPCHLLASASRYGLIFVGTRTSVFKVIQITDIEAYAQKDGDLLAYKCRNVDLPSPPTHLSVNCDNTKLAVVIEKNQSCVAIIYSVASFLRKDISIIQEIRLSSAPHVTILETTWNPTLPDVFTACKSDGTLGVYEFKDTGININELPVESQASCMCWSPKGKQIAVGSSIGKITQYKPDLKAVKVINAPPLEGSYSVVSIHWISSFQFIAVYHCTSSDTGSILLVIDAPKVGDIVYTNYEDICYSYGSFRPAQFYMLYEPLWNILMVASSNSMEVGVLNSEKEQWIQWILADTARAELPLSSSKQETFPVGLCFDKSSAEPVPWGENFLPSVPFLFLLSHHGVLCCFRMINVKSDTATICQAPEKPLDTSGLNLFITSSHEQKIPEIAPEVPKQLVTQTPVAVLPAIPLKETQPSALNNTPFTSQPSSFSTSFFANAFRPPSQEQTNLLPKLSSSSKKFVTNVTVTQTLVVTSAISTVSTTPAVSISSSLGKQTPDAKIEQKEVDFLLSKLIREECETLGKELDVLLHKGSLLKIELGTDEEAVKLVQDADFIQNFLKDLIETSSVQAAEVNSLKQGLIQTWTWYEDARSRSIHSQDMALDALFRMQQLDPVSIRYLTSIEHLTYYLESQLNQAGRVLDEQWENFQDSCKKVIKIRVPTIETIYQTMVRQSVVHQKQKYVLKDILSRIRAQRRKVRGRSIFVSLNNAEILEKELLQLQFDSNNILSAQYDRVVETQEKLTVSKIEKLRKLLTERDVTHISVNKPELSNVSLQTILNTSTQAKTAGNATIFGTEFSPIVVSKANAIPRIIDFVQSTPKNAAPISTKIEKKDEANVVKIQAGALEIPVNLCFPAKTNLHPNPEKTPFDFSSNIKNSFTFTQPTSAATNENLNKLNTKSNSTFTFVKPTTTLAVNSTNNFTPATTSSFTSLFGTKGTFSATPFNVTPVAGGEMNKPISNTSNSAFVPTTQLAFTFTAKSITTTPSSTVTAPKLSNLSFGFSTINSEGSQTPTLVKPDPFSSNTNTIKSISLKQSSLPNIASEATVLKIPNITSTATIVPSSNLVPTPFSKPVSTTIASSIFQSTTEGASFNNSSNTDSAFNFSNTTITANHGLNSKISFAQSNQNNVSSTEPSTSTSSVFSDVMLKTPTSTNSVEPIKTSSVIGISPNSISTTSSSNLMFGGSEVSASSAVDNKTTTCIFSTSLTPTSTSNIFESKPTSVSPSTIFGTTTVTTTTPSSGLQNILFGSKTPALFGGATTTTTSAFNTTTTISAPIFCATATTASIPIFGSATTITATTSIFGTTTTASIFGAVPISTAIFENGKTTTTSTSNSIFKTTTTTSSSIPIFGSTTTTAPAPILFGTTTASSTPLFGSPTVTSSSTIFSVPPITVETQAPKPSSTSSIFPSTFNVVTTSSVFGSGTPTSNSVFSSPTFGTTSSFGFSQPVTTPSAVFGSSNSSVFGKPPTTSNSSFNVTSNSFESSPSLFGGTSSFFGAPTTRSNVFASTNKQTPAFGTGGSIFGNSPTSNAGFSQSSSSSFSFSAAAANIPNIDSKFGVSKSFGFGSPQSNPESGNSFSFNPLSMGPSTTTASTTFGSPTANPFAKSSDVQKPAFEGGSLFGTPTTTTSFFGRGSNSSFGNSPSQTFGSPVSFGSNATAFGQPATFGQSAFGSPFVSPQPSAQGPFSGGSQSVAQSGFGAFGQPQQKSPGFGAAPVFGGSPSGFGAPPAFGSAPPVFGASTAFGSPNKVFGEPPSTQGAFTGGNQQNPTFANLATQNTLGFGSLAQQSPSLPTQAPPSK